ncbi:hypothetical protein M8T07_07680 [Enterobacter hormaechei]|nr:hypothetical protein [Enterobacter hormaechei]
MDVKEEGRVEGDIKPVAGALRERRLGLLFLCTFLGVLASVVVACLWENAHDDPYALLAVAVGGICWVLPGGTLISFAVVAIAERLNVVHSGLIGLAMGFIVYLLTFGSL